MAPLDPWTLWIPDYHRMRFDYALHEGPMGEGKDQWVVWLKVSDGVVLDARWTGSGDPEEMGWVGSLPGQCIQVSEAGVRLMGYGVVPHDRSLPGCAIPTHAPVQSATTPEC